tara:strand:+ start:75 stop:542 length:468 start_codon:yes stop_codon:yes gene_type:complete
MNKFIFKILVLLLISSCGFKVVNQSSLINFSISKITMVGDKRINYNLKNKILSTIKDTNNRTINLIVNTKKEKTIKDKNIKNEIIKYQIKVSAIVKIKDKNYSNIKPINIEQIGNFDVANQYSQTLNNEKNLIKTLSESLANELIDEIIRRMNDL